MHLLQTYPNTVFYFIIPHGDLGVKSRMCPPYPQRVVKGD